MNWAFLVVVLALVCYFFLFKSSRAKYSDNELDEKLKQAMIKLSKMRADGALKEADYEKLKAFFNSKYGTGTDDKSDISGNGK